MRFLNGWQPARPSKRTCVLLMPLWFFIKTEVLLGIIYWLCPDGLKQKDTVHLYHTPANLSGDPHPLGFNVENNIKHHKKRVAPFGGSKKLPPYVVDPGVEHEPRRFFDAFWRSPLPAKFQDSRTSVFVRKHVIFKFEIVSSDAVFHIFMQMSNLNLCRSM